MPLTCALGYLATALHRVGNFGRPTDGPRRRRGRRPRLELEPLEARVTLSADPVVGVGTGLIANYYSNQTLTNLAATRTDAAVDFTWGSGSPAAGVPADHFSARWTGQVQAQYSETYTFYTRSDDGVRLWVNGQLLINNWTTHLETENSGTIALQAGETYDVKLEYFDATGPATVRLLWSSPSTAREVIPARQLYPSAGWVSAGWLNADVGSPGRAGSVRSAGPTTNPTYTVQGGGADIWGSADQFHFAYRTLTGDGEVVARVTAVQNTHPWAKAGVMIRATNAADAAFAALFLTPGNGASFQYRTAPGGSAASVTAAGITAPRWVKVVRNGSFVTGYTSATGADNSWILRGTVALTLPDPVQVGLAVTAHDNAALNTSTFTGVRVTPAVPLGANLGGVVDWARSNAFVDVAKQARKFGPPGAPWDHEHPVPVDADGWPTQDFGAIFFTDVVHAGGTYRLSFTGRANIRPVGGSTATIQNVVHDPGANTTTADVVVADTADRLMLAFENTTGGVRNLRLLRPGYALTATPDFTTEFLNHLRPFSTLRFMDWTSTNNNNGIVNWGDRARVTDARQVATGTRLDGQPQAEKGVAWEYCIQLANELHKDLWVNLPVNASDDYVRQLATLLRTTLHPDRVVYLEYSNELWNYGTFEQGHDNRRAAVAEVEAGIASGNPSPLAYPGEGPSAEYDWASRRVAKRLKEISDLFRSVWGNEAINTRVRPVLAGQSANPWGLKEGLEFLERTYGSPNPFIYAVAGAPYFYLGVNDQEDNRTDLTVDEVLAAMSTSISSVAAEYPPFHRWARHYNLKSLSYEGGPDTAGGNNIAAKKAASLDARMQGLVTNYLQGWYSSGGGMFTWYFAGASNYDTSFGTWGLTDDMTNQAAPKIQALNAVLSTPRTKLTGGYALPGSVDARNYVDLRSPCPADPRLQKPNAGCKYEYLVRAPQAGQYDLRISVAAVNSGAQLRVQVNGGAATTLPVPVSGGEDTFVDTAVVALTLTPGLNVVRLEVATHQAYKIQALTFTAPPAGAPGPGGPDGEPSPEDRTLARALAGDLGASLAGAARPAPGSGAPTYRAAPADREGGARAATAATLGRPANLPARGTGALRPGRPTPLENLFGTLAGQEFDDPLTSSCWPCARVSTR